MPSGKTDLLNSTKFKKRPEQHPWPLCFSLSANNVMKTHPHSSKTISDIVHDLEEIQHHLLMIKAAGLAYTQCFHDAAPIACFESPYNASETAEYFVYQFLKLDPDAKIEAAMDAIWELQRQLDHKPTQSVDRKSQDTTIKISIGKD